MYPDRASTVIPAIRKCLQHIDEPSGKAATIWMIGEYGHLIDESPYLLEPLIDDADTATDPDVLTELLTAATKLFFKRPPEMQKMLGRLFDTLLADGVPVRVHDKALLYYRLLSRDVRAAGQIISGDKTPVREYLEDRPSKLQSQVLNEFNTLSVIYGKPAEQFVPESYRVVVEVDPTDVFDDNHPPSQASASAEAAASTGDDGLDMFGGGSEPMAAGGSTAPASQTADDDLDFFGGGGGSSTAEPAPAASGAFDDDFDLLGIGSSPAPAPPALQLVPHFAMDPPTFQQHWMSLSEGYVS